MTTRDQAIELAKRDASTTGQAMAVLNLNPFRPLYVVRYWNDRMARERGAIKVHPDQVCEYFG